MKAGKKNPQVKKGDSVCTWQNLAIGVTMILVPWALYVNFNPSLAASGATADGTNVETVVAKTGAGFFFPMAKVVDVVKSEVANVADSTKVVSVPSLLVDTTKSTSTAVVAQSKLIRSLEPPILGAIPTAGAVPLYGVKHDGGDAIFALACNYPKVYYQRFVGSLRKFGYDGDIVLAVSPPEKMKVGVADYIKETKVVAYGFEVDCAGPDNCRLKDEFLGYADPRPHRTFANIRYALYEYWLRQYSAQSYILILDFRDTFFQGMRGREICRWSAAVELSVLN